MKKTFILAMAAVATLSLTGCGSMGQSMTTSALTGNAASGSNTTSSLASMGTGVLGTVLTSLLGNKTTQNSIVGTWTYNSPKVVFESDNILAKLGSSVASSKIEEQLGSMLGKVGFKAGVTGMTFSKDGSCSLNLSNKSLPGTYTYNTSTNVMTVTGAFGKASISPTVSVTGNQMYMVFEADKLLSMVTSLAGATSTTSTLGSLLKNYNGLKLGWTMTKK